MKRYLIIESKKEIFSEEPLIISLFSEFIEFTHKENSSHTISLYFEHETDVSFSDLILNIMSDTLSDLRIYVSYQFESDKELKLHKEFIVRKLETIPFYKYVYIDDKIIVKESIHNLDDEIKHMIFRKYFRDQSMLESIKLYLESNQSTSKASKNLYVHRNTLLQRLDKFYYVTGFDVRLFMDAYLIYLLLK
ncbi:MAG: helix-turn-helix domain-containing protein [Acholeplasmataceae bacterium]|nr:helix-turn-helix domain-containing protein [Acholeplasmataceae bacterium]